MNENEEAAIRARVEAATEGPWTARHNYVDDDLDEYRDSDICFHPTAKVFNGVPQVLGYVDLAEEDAEFIAHARTDLPAALDKITRLRAALDEARAEVERLHAEAIDSAHALEAAESALVAVRALVDTACHHCGSGPDADGDHSCPCPLSNSECLEHTLRPVMPGGLRAALAASAFATASEGATARSCKHCGAIMHSSDRCALRPKPATGVTSSDGNRRLSEDEREAIERAVCTLGKVECQVLGHDHARHLNRLIPLIERILAARTAQSEGVERVEWGVLVGDDDPDYAKRPDAPPMRFVDRENAVLAARRVAGRTLVRRTVTEYAPVTGPWEVVGDE